MRESILRKARESADTKLRFFEDNVDRLEQCVRALAERMRAGGRLLVMGNGGSACDAQHVAVEFQHPIIEKRRPLTALSLGVDSAMLTAVGNDTDFSHVFAVQLELLARPGDAALGISTSGASANVNRALKRAHELGLLTIGFGGRDGGAMVDLCDHCFVVESWAIHRIQETHTTLLHLLWDMVHVALGEDDVLEREATLPFGECPVPLVETNEILLGHGSGGRLSADLVEKLLLPALRNPMLEPLDDAALVDVGGARLAFTTDSYVVTPIFFPGGDIGELAVNGTVNDLAVSGATPLALSLAFILEEGLPIVELERVVASVRAAAARARVSIVTGDTKVVGRGAADRLYVNTAGIGLVPPGVSVGARRVRAGDAILVSGTIGDHGVAILSRRAGLEFEGDLRSDTAPLHDLCAALLRAAGPSVHAMRDPTRGGVAATLVEIASRNRLGVEVDERDVPIDEVVRGACEMLGLDPLLVANEGKLVAFVAEEAADAALASLRAHPLGRRAARIGRVTDEHAGRVILETPIGGERILDLPYGEALPRIC